MPGVPAEDEITADLTKLSASPGATFGSSISSTGSAQPSSAMQLTFQDKLEDIRDIITETNTYKVVSKRAVALRKVSSVVWTRVQRVAWVVGTSALILVVPLLYEVDREMTVETPATGSSPTPSTAPLTDSSATSSTPASTSATTTDASAAATTPSSSS